MRTKRRPGTTFSLRQDRLRKRAVPRNDTHAPVHRDANTRVVNARRGQITGIPTPSLQRYNNETDDFATGTSIFRAEPDTRETGHRFFFSPLSFRTASLNLPFPSLRFLLFVSLILRSAFSIPFTPSEKHTVLRFSYRTPALIIQTRLSLPVFFSLCLFSFLDFLAHFRHRTSIRSLLFHA